MISLSPFGVSLRRMAGTNHPIPIDTWEYYAPFLPDGAIPIPTATNSSNLAEPLVFVSLVTSRPETRESPRRIPSPLGAGRVCSA